VTFLFSPTFVSSTVIAWEALPIHELAIASHFFKAQLQILNPTILAVIMKTIKIMPFF
jgi:hypothetical protein